MSYLFLSKKQKYSSCGGMCAQPYDQKAAAILLLLGLCNILPIELNIVSFYFIPRRFQVVSGEDNIILENSLESPLLGIQNELYNDDLDWQTR